MTTTPIEILYVWEGHFGRLDERQRRQFLQKKEIAFLTKYSINLIQDAVLAENLSLRDILKYVNDNSDKSPNPSLDTKVTSVGAYLFGGIVYSIRRDRKTYEWQVWTFVDKQKKYVRIPQPSRERLLLKRISPMRRLTREMAMNYSIETGLCCHCGRTLTAGKSVSRGMGPICAKNYQ